MEASLVASSEIGGWLERLLMRLARLYHMPHDPLLRGRSRHGDQARQAREGCCGPRDSRHRAQTAARCAPLFRDVNKGGKGGTSGEWLCANVHSVRSDGRSGENKQGAWRRDQRPSLLLIPFTLLATTPFRAPPPPPHTPMPTPTPTLRRAVRSSAALLTVTGRRSAIAQTGLGGVVDGEQKSFAFVCAVLC
jgi:hypothetical protein